MNQNRLRRVESLERFRPARQTDPFATWARGLSDDELDHAIDLAGRRYRGEALTPIETAEVATWPHAGDMPGVTDAEIDGRIAALEETATMCSAHKHGEENRPIHDTLTERFSLRQNR